MSLWQLFFILSYPLYKSTVGLGKRTKKINRRVCGEVYSSRAPIHTWVFPSVGVVLSVTFIQGLLCLGTNDFR